jgi:hypothetical protein
MGAGANNERYLLVGRYMKGTEVTGYHIVFVNGDEHRKVTKEQFAFLLGKGAIVNCTGQIYGDRLIVRSVSGVDINKLPVYDEQTSSIKKVSDEYIKVSDKDDAGKLMSQYVITARIMRGKNNIGFELRNYGGQVLRLSRDKVIELASKKLIANAIVQNLNKGGETKKVLRGHGIDLRELPTIHVNS